jgi:hypothetical protein
METRKITVVSTKAQRKYVLETTASTLEELKAAMNEAGIDYNNMTFFEGLSKTELKANDSQLPHDVNYKGNITNDLVIMLTLANKNIKSGSERAAIYEKIKELNLQERIKRDCGKNYTNCSTEELNHYLNVCCYNTKDTEDTEVNIEDTEETVEHYDTKADAERFMKGVSRFIAFLIEECGVSTETLVDIIYNRDSELQPQEAAKEEPKVDSPYSDSEIEDMFSNLVG